MKLTSFALLTTVYRSDPCAEYPGTWIVYVNGVDVAHFVDTPLNVSAKGLALARARNEKDDNYDAKVSIAWQANDNDPRIGKVWFTGYYTAYEL